MKGHTQSATELKIRSEAKGPAACRRSTHSLLFAIDMTKRQALAERLRRVEVELQRAYAGLGSGAAALRQSRAHPD